MFGLLSARGKIIVKQVYTNQSDQSVKALQSNPPPHPDGTHGIRYSGVLTAVLLDVYFYELLQKLQHNTGV